MSQTQTRYRLGVTLMSVVGVSAVSFVMCVGVPCLPLGLRYGVHAPSCPSGAPRVRLSADAHGIVRGGEGWVTVSTSLAAPFDDVLDGEVSSHPMRWGVAHELTLIDDEGAIVPGFEVRDWDGDEALVYVPAVPDADYRLRVEARSGIGDVTVDLPLPLYAPAVGHVLSDRPLYRPGDTVNVRSLLVARDDQRPLDGRPGIWKIYDPNQQEMLVERDRAGAWGIADTTFPLSDDAAVGAWTIAWVSGATEVRSTFDVRPFVLPRLTVTAAPEKSWYAIGGVPTLSGVATYASGAPVAGAVVEVTLTSRCSWPIPIAWEDPRVTRTDASGRFTASWGDVPADLVGKADLFARVKVTDPVAGEVVEGGAGVVLSQRPLLVDAVTDLGGLVGKYNNRVYLRVTRPDGAPLRDSPLVVGPAWDPEAPRKEARTDVDGVAALQIDPGDPVTVVIPAMPVRPRPMVPDAPRVTRAVELLSSRAADLDLRRAFDALTPEIARCGDWVRGPGSASVVLIADGSGGVRPTASKDAPLDQCVAAAMRPLRVAPGALGVWSVDWSVPDTLRPSLDLKTELPVGNGVATRLGDAAARARRCLPMGIGIDGAEVITGVVVAATGDRRLSVTTRLAPGGTGLSAAALSCVAASFQGIDVGAPLTGPVSGGFVASLSVPRPPGAHQPGPTTTLGYELEVAVVDEPSQRGRVVVEPGAVPPLRLRPEPSIVRPGDRVTMEFVRSPEYYGQIPEHLRLYHQGREIAKEDVDVEAGSVVFEVPSDVLGFVSAEWDGARAVVLVERPARFGVTLGSDAAVYRPGDVARLTVTTKIGDAPVAAGVSLAGVDSTLGQLAPLPGPDAMAGLVVGATSHAPAFGVFDAGALARGAIRGENAARAALLRVATIEELRPGDEPVSASSSSPDDTPDRMAAGFYRALLAAQAQVDAWEASAGPGDQLTYPVMFELWQAGLDALEAAGTPAVDGFDRPIRLEHLPPLWAEQANPRSLVSDATRIPEDTTSWELFLWEQR